jgi:hypothetical protein
MGATEEIYYGRLGSRAAALPPICEPKCRDEIDIFVQGLNPLVDEHPIFRKEGGSATELKNSHQFPPECIGSGLRSCSIDTRQIHEARPVHTVGHLNLSFSQIRWDQGDGEGRGEEETIMKRRKTGRTRATGPSSAPRAREGARYGDVS